jgi:hypothetical protein
MFDLKEHTGPFKVRASRILSFEGSVAKFQKDPSLRSGQALNLEP